MEREELIEEVHNSIVEVIARKRLPASDIILVLELIKGDIIKQIKQRYYGSLSSNSPETPSTIQGGIHNTTPEMPEVPKEA